ncbi:hypothetical protein GGI20_001923 [Coemansia sp. BCRC 34301]|nr:hypothetical protein GGI20_001923 [Coemansia sp. BCRC 34301]
MSMERKVISHTLALERNFVAPVVTAMLHTILFHRYFGNVTPKDNHILANITYTSVDDSSVAATVADKVKELMQTISSTTSAEDQAKQAIFHVIKEMDRNKDHIPLIANSQTNPFPYHISVTPASGLWSSMIKRAIRPSIS